MPSLYCCACLSHPSTLHSQVPDDFFFLSDFGIIFSSATFTVGGGFTTFSGASFSTVISTSFGASASVKVFILTSIGASAGVVVFSSVEALAPTSFEASARTFCSDSVATTRSSSVDNSASAATIVSSSGSTSCRICDFFFFFPFCDGRNCMPAYAFFALAKACLSSALLKSNLVDGDSPRAVRGDTPFIHPSLIDESPLPSNDLSLLISPSAVALSIGAHVASSMSCSPNSGPNSHSSGKFNSHFLVSAPLVCTTLSSYARKAFDNKENDCIFPSINVTSCHPTIFAHLSLLLASSLSTIFFTPIHSSGLSSDVSIR